jgi:hypothetical protein
LNHRSEDAENDDQGESELKASMVDYILEVVSRIQHYYGAQGQRIRYLKVLYPNQPIMQADIRYWLDLYPDNIINRIYRGRLFIELDHWLVDTDIAKIFEDRHGSDLERFYSDEDLAKRFPLLFELFRSLLLLNPSSAFNERINSILGNIRSKKRKSLEFSSTRAIVMTKANADLVDCENKRHLHQI